ncbi:hypothetical protein BC835DRAFT_266150 [Cytidiella melzeri]|nr:hypothetical protein BC835DRAFT_266150 [Cytidiella melzeri]
MEMDNTLASGLTGEESVARTIEQLPKLAAKDVPLDDSCPICLNPFSAILDGSVQNEGSAQALNVSPKLGELSGVTKLEGCGHVFCKVDLVEWIRGGHGTCPACRHTFLDIRPMFDSDDESSDGDYIPGEPGLV